MSTEIIPSNNRDDYLAPRTENHYHQQQATNNIPFLVSAFLVVACPLVSWVIWATYIYWIGQVLAYAIVAAIVATVGWLIGFLLIDLARRFAPVYQQYRAVESNLSDSTVKPKRVVKPHTPIKKGRRVS